MTFSKVSSLRCVFLALCVFHPFALPSPSFPLTHPLMVIYLVGKGSAFSPERSTTGREQKPRKRKSTERREGAGRNGRKERKIYHSCRSPQWHELSLPLSLTAVMEVKVWPQTDGRKKRITCQYLFPLAAWIEKDTLHSLSLFPPKANSRALPLFRIRRTSGVAWEKADMAR